MKEDSTALAIRRREEEPLEDRATASAMLALLAKLPKSAQMALNYGALKDATAWVLVEDRIHQAYSAAAHIMTELARWKRSQGFCGGESSCMRYVGLTDRKGQPLPAIMCSSCRARARERRAAALVFKKPRRLTEYGRIRAEARARQEKKAGR